MALYRAKAPDGTQIQFEATSLSDAKAIYKERYGKLPLSIGKVIGGGEPTTLSPPETVPGAEPEAGLPTFQPTYPITGGVTPAPSTTQAPYPPTAYTGFGTYPGVMGFPFNLPPPSETEQAEYGEYVEFLKTDEAKNFPVPKDIYDFLAHAETWNEDAELYVRGYTDDQLRAYRQYLSYWGKWADRDAWKPVSVEEFLANQSFVTQQMAQWRQLEQQAQAEQQLADQYALDPAEAARRREWRYGREVVAAGEAYREQPMYSETFNQWMSQQSAMSGAFSGFVESKYPSLRGEFQAGQPRLTGFPTPTAARAEAGRREAGWQGWLPQQVPGLYQEYMGQPAYMRGERLREYSPTLRAVNW